MPKIEDFDLFGHIHKNYFTTKFQPIFMSQDDGTFYGVFIKFDFYKDSGNIEFMNFILINYNKFNKADVGFPKSGISKNCFKKDNNILKINLPINKTGSNYIKKTKVHFENNENYNLNDFEMIGVKKNHNFLEGKFNWDFPEKFEIQDYLDHLSSVNNFNVLPNKFFHKSHILAFHLNCEQSVVGLVL